MKHFIKTISKLSPIKKVLLLGLFVFVVWFAFCLPRPLFHSPTSTMVEDEHQQLIGAKIAEDGQWRFPYNQEVPEKFSVAIIQYEDQHFYRHLGINPIAILSAAKTNLKAGEIKRGGSTITQQTIRLARNNPSRTIWEKVYEAVLAFRLELGFSKKKILSFYASNAPFGGNVVGVDAAAWRYFGRSASELSWAEAATLAVLPNAPGLIHPGKNREQLELKRNQLLEKLLKNGKIDQITYEISIQEPLPNQPHPLPRYAPHLVEQIHQTYEGERIVSSIQLDWQLQASQVLESHQLTLGQNQIHNASAIIIDVKTKTVKVYVGNTAKDASHQNQVDCIQAARSTGSLLKPFLYAASLDAGQILPESLVPDIPTYYNNYSPKNFSETFSGAVPANQALAKSLNIPAVRLLDDYGIPKFHHLLQEIQLEDIKYKASHYGLPLILGGAESSLWDMTRAYAGMASTLNHFTDTQGHYYHNEYSQLSLLAEQPPRLRKRKQHEVFSAASIWHTMNALVEAKRPGKEKAWEYFSNSQTIAWKTGTSFGNKDAWAIGVNPDYVIGVWVGNADGEGRTGNTGLATAAPILFDLVELLPHSNEWFTAPVEELYSTVTCEDSGQLANPYCNRTDTSYVSQQGRESKSCIYHQLVTTTADKTYQINYGCAEDQEIIQTSFFVLPPKQAMFYAKHHVQYEDLPPVFPDCVGEQSQDFSILYPHANASLSIPTNIQGERESIVAKVATKARDTKLFWYLDERFIGTTTSIHQMEITANPGQHILGIVNAEGKKVSQIFSVK